MKPCQLTVPGHVRAGENVIEQLSGIIEAERASKVIVFTDEGVLSTGICNGVFEQIKKANAEYCVIGDLRPEPSTQDVIRTMEQMNRAEGELVVAVGGGSVMDMAKLCAAMKGASYDIYDLLENNSLMEKGLPAVMIPTTCGTGSEATFNAIVAVPEKSVKTGIVNKNMLADYVLLDGNMIAKLPPKIIASSGVDALAHVIECFTSNKANVFSDLYAAAGAKLIFENLVRAYSDANDLQAKSNMLLAAFYGGVAIAASGTTAVHALAYPLGGKYHIAHGVSNAILLAPVMRANLEACEDRLALLEDGINPAGYGRAQSEKAKGMIERIASIVSDTGIPSSLCEFGIGLEDLDFLVDAAADCKRLLDNNRRVLTKNDIRAIYQEVIKGGI
ncbi:iron-containing alcohol dehydrogenase [Geosporobacter ferrireducens]|uniref:Alcohol dehydrogenase n=1 Tax=Geosporobacter ferrireducens TaxID=1424294 RepID=A0A1D8GF92_9FIRM|nr:iron-containing alcohol dehydrogenase [Geosporobacter ferrireducens]AOT69586.1 alcohol dehydrogenase [Geosporobacter ferrireducens]MTI54719.1 iron-containing alcohol dehydrogenase [Geosporobacter ferrireducens]